METLGMRFWLPFILSIVLPLIGMAFAVKYTAEAASLNIKKIEVRVKELEQRTESLDVVDEKLNNIIRSLDKLDRRMAKYDTFNLRRTNITGK